MNMPGPGPDLGEHYDRRATLIEDIVNMLSILVLLVLLMSRGRISDALYWPLMSTLLVVVMVLFIRRQARVNRLLRRMRAAYQQDTDDVRAGQPRATSDDTPRPMKQKRR